MIEDNVMKGHTIAESNTPCHIAFIHPDLGIGGAEQLIVSAALGLQNYTRTKYLVELYTSLHDINHCFEETRDGTLKVTKYGSWLPRSIFGFGVAFCAIVRMLWIFLVLFQRKLVEGTEFDILIVDQVSAINPLYKLLCKKLIFYCHFPDLLLCTERKTCMKRIYRKIIDELESSTTGLADALLVNSEFTGKVLSSTFPHLKSQDIKVVYPPVDIRSINIVRQSISSWSTLSSRYPAETKELRSGEFVLSLNRYERKKNIDLAIQAIHWIKQKVSLASVPKLVIAGGFDSRLPENAEVFYELQQLSISKGLKINEDIIFLKSIPSDLRWGLLLHCRAVLYTPANEHFGIVPVEAMALGTVVIARNSGGPKESIVHGETGFLCEDDPNDSELGHHFGETLLHIMQTRQDKMDQFKISCQKRVENRFGLDTFSRTLNSIIHELLEPSESVTKEKCFLTRYNKPTFFLIGIVVLILSIVIPLFYSWNYK